MTARLATRMHLGIVCSALLAGWPLAALADCVLVPTAGDDAFTCSSGSSAGVVDTAGNNTLLFPAAGTGVINGNVTFGPGGDLVTMNSGTVDGAVNMGDGANIFQLFGGTVTGSIIQGAGNGIVQISQGSAGAVIQGLGNDNFAMSGGTIASVTQGDGDNKATLSTGRIDGDMTAGNGNNKITIANGSIGGKISVGNGGNEIIVKGGDITGGVQAGNGNNLFTWQNAGLIHGPIVTGSGTDRAFLTALTETIIASTPLLDGGLGNDSLTFDNTRAATPSRYAHWETITLNNTSVFTLGSGTFTLGDAGTHTGTMDINIGTLLVTQGSISPFTAGQLTTVNNGGLIDMTSASTTATDSLTINGNYTGNNGQLALQSVLAGDNAPSDKLVVNKGTMQGSTTINVTNLAGPGAMTVQNGILVVQAANGATASDLAFSLRGGAVSAGAYDYYLYKGGVTPGTAQNWYLRSSVEAPPLPTPEGPVGIIPPVPPDGGIIPPVPPDVGIFPPVPADGTPGTPGIFPGEEPIPIYRPEVADYSVLFPAVQQMVQGMLSTYHERMGDQGPPQPTGAAPAGWARVFGSSTRQSFSGTVSPTLDSSLSGFQVGTDLYAWTSDNGLTQRVGFFVGHSRLTGNVQGFAGGFQNIDTGDITLRADSLGTYWTLIGANRAYLDLVLMGTRFDGHDESRRGIKLQTKGHNVAGSAEVGMPFAVSEHWEVEPQAQVIIDRSWLDSQNDGIADISFKADTAVTTRLGVRLRGDYTLSGMPVQPYVRANVWHAGSGTNTVRFDDSTAIDTEQRSTTMEVSAGATLQVSKAVKVYGEVGYNWSMDGNPLNSREGTLGVKIDF
ncbi:MULTISPECIES: autotransporter outer membrane beta-barrel domain-containing protein [unclassified Pseudomonas]|uniref:autotransporter family protein n=1 Tax=unclassified Pseudomonas TaxID=196821 RepID=UPI0015A0233A|nr:MULTISPECIES: autotransporter outer membrane beta-barrel domain-containing protein [unclassified Pseudomonas]NWC92719.1 autotransporter outer membrane beta-barrel domain-containing protein [Pseudomonas sp. IPO3779]NWD17433.1 autotransporter outer membrane beta-barrel domain-containing protein [Pseudomonas sp. IPO3778]